MNDTALDFLDVRFSYGSCQVLHGVSAQVSRGKITALFGPNGSGKTTLLKCLAGLARPASGIILAEGTNIFSVGAKRVSKLVSYVPQEHAVSFGFTVEEVILMGRTPYLGGLASPSAADYAAAQQAVEAVHLQDIAHKPYTELSGGQRQLVLIARALSQATPIMIMDEPTSALDFRNQLLVWEQLQALRDQGKTILVCTHDPNHVMWFCDDVLVLQSGRILQAGSTRQLMTKDLLCQLYGPICSIQNNAVIPQGCS